MRPRVQNIIFLIPPPRLVFNFVTHAKLLKINLIVFVGFCADAMEASQMYCDMPPQSAFNLAAAAAAATAGYNHHASLPPPTPPHAEEEPVPQLATVPLAAVVPPPPAAAVASRQHDLCPSKRPAAATTASGAEPQPNRAPREQVKRPKRQECRAPSPDIDIVNVQAVVVRSFGPDALKPRQEKIWRPYGATDE